MDDQLISTIPLFASLPPTAIAQLAQLKMHGGGMFVTAPYGILDARQRTLHYVRAGHEVPLLLDPQGQVIHPVYGPGQALGIFASPALNEQVLSFRRGATLLLYTAGLTVVADPAGDFLGAERVEQTSRPAASAQHRSCATSWSPW